MSLQVRPPEDLLLKLADGDWIVVKKRLTAGETQKVFARMVESVEPGEEGEDGKTKARMKFDIGQMGGLSQCVEYLLDWSAKDADGKILPMRDKRGELSPRLIQAGLESLPHDAFKEISDAIESHIKAMEEEIAGQKKASAGETVSSATSSSAGTTTGPTTTS